MAFVSKCIASPSGGTLLDELKAHPDLLDRGDPRRPEEMSFEQAQDLLARGATDMIVEPVTALGGLRTASAPRTSSAGS